MEISILFFKKVQNKIHYAIHGQTAADVFFDIRQFYVLDAIELFARHSMLDDYEAQINAILKLNEIAFQLSNGKMINSLDAQINQNSLETVQEVGLKELLQQASSMTRFK